MECMDRHYICKCISFKAPGRPSAIATPGCADDRRSGSLRMVDVGEAGWDWHHPSASARRTVRVVLVSPVNRMKLGTQANVARSVTGENDPANLQSATTSSSSGVDGGHGNRSGDGAIRVSLPRAFQSCGI
ncbi:hypothetical protein LZ30DRAFT_47549 [Colletotrichum cereale]|nr:hypothetical protein LZ30DRAFT_47549 [Colletotrichum cereale]